MIGRGPCVILDGRGAAENRGGAHDHVDRPSECNSADGRTWHKSVSVTQNQPSAASPSGVREAVRTLNPGYFALVMAKGTPMRSRSRCYG